VTDLSAVRHGVSSSQSQSDTYVRETAIVLAAKRCVLLPSRDIRASVASALRRARPRRASVWHGRNKMLPSSAIQRCGRTSHNGHYHTSYLRRERRLPSPSPGRHAAEFVSRKIERCHRQSDSTRTVIMHRSLCTWERLTAGEKKKQNRKHEYEHLYNVFLSLETYGYWLRANGTALRVSVIKKRHFVFVIVRMIFTINWEKGISSVFDPLPQPFVAEPCNILCTCTFTWVYSHCVYDSQW